MKIHLSPISSNAKTGPIPVSTSSSDTCPPSCPFNRGGGCYAGSGPLMLHWRKVTSGERGDEFPVFLSRVRDFPAGQVWRMNQAGDLPGAGDKLDRVKLRELVEANRGRRGFTYTHKPLKSKADKEAIKKANEGGFTVNLSGNNPKHADRLADLKIGPVVTVLPANSPDKLETPAGRKIIVCPAQQIEGITCATCRLCSRSTRSVIIGFRAHGTGAKKAGAIATI